MNRSFLFSCTTALLIVLALEASSYGVYFITQHKAFSYSDVKNSEAAIAGESSDQKSDEKVSVWQQHPYLGYVLKPSHGEKRFLPIHGGLVINDYGFVDFGDEFLDQQKDNVNVVVTGASVALQCVRNSRNTLIDRLKEMPQFKGKKLHVTPLAINTFKEPQQLFAVLYYLTLGGKIDVLINIDGYNEVMMTPVLMAQKIAPTYPYHWANLGLQELSPERVTLLYNMQSLRAKQLQMAAIARRLSFSVTVGTFWTLLNNHFENKIARLQQESIEDGNKELIAGPPISGAMKAPEVLKQESVRVWRLNSIYLSEISKASNIPYFQFLQPNQYVAGSKQFTDQEREHALGETSMKTKAVAEGYVLLKAEVPALQQAGVNIRDLTGIYKNVPDTIYIDPCCHMNRKGSDMIMNAVADAVAEYYGKQPKTTPANF